ncbi:MAG TPA: POTRA domain-containing protein, partial [Stellaceae bacterium]
MRTGATELAQHRSPWRRAVPAAAMAWAIAGVSAHAQTPGIGPPPSLPEHRGAPIVPQLQPGAPPPPSLAVPAPTAAPAAPTTKAGPRFVLRDVKITGNTVLDPAAIRAIVAPYLGKPVGSDDLEEIRRKFTRLYIDRGYVNSGAVLPDQNVAGGIVTYRFVEGRASEIDITGTDHFKPEYFRSRL